MVLFCPLGINRYIHLIFSSRLWPCSLVQRLHIQVCGSVGNELSTHPQARTNPSDLLQSYLPWVATPAPGKVHLSLHTETFQHWHPCPGVKGGSWAKVGLSCLLALSSHSLGMCHATGCHSRLLPKVALEQLKDTIRWEALLHLSSLSSIYCFHPP